MGMIASVLQRISSRDAMALVLIILMEVQACAQDSREYRESQEEVARFIVEQSDPVLRVTQFLKLQDGTLIRPQLYCYQYRTFLFAPRRVEESIGNVQSTAPQKKNFLYLPNSDEIVTYLLLVRKPLPKEVEVDGRTKTEYDWTEWHLLQVSAKDIALDKPLVIPPFDQIVEESKQHKELQEKVRTMYETARVEAEKKMNTPGPPRVVPRIAK